MDQCIPMRFIDLQKKSNELVVTLEIFVIFKV